MRWRLTVVAALSLLLVQAWLHAPGVLGLTPTPTGEGSINGVVYESPSGVLRGATITLNPIGLQTMTSLDDGSFHFASVPNGDYTLTVSPGCTPYGCFAPEPVTVAGTKVDVAIYPQSFTPTPTPTSQRLYGLTAEVTAHEPSPAIAGESNTWTVVARNTGTQFGCDDSPFAKLQVTLTDQADPKFSYDLGVLACLQEVTVEVTSLVTAPAGGIVTIQACISPAPPTGAECRGSSDAVVEAPPAVGGIARPPELEAQRAAGNRDAGVGVAPFLALSVAGATGALVIGAWYTRRRAHE